MEKLKVIKRTRSYKFNIDNANISIIKAAVDRSYHEIRLTSDAIITDDNLRKKLMYDIGAMLSYQNIEVKVNISRNIFIIYYPDISNSAVASLNAKIVENLSNVTVYLENTINVIEEDITDEKK